MSKDYGQFCGLAHAARALGERWALLVVRDLSVGPRRFTDLHGGLAGIPTTVLTTRLRELEEAGVVERRTAAPGERGIRYALTPYGQDLVPVLDALGRWGARRMAAPAPTEIATAASLAAALHAAYQPGASTPGTTYLVRSGPVAAWAAVQEDAVTVGEGDPPAAPTLTLTAGPELRLLLAGRISAAEATSTGAVETDGTPAQLDTFLRTFHVPLDDDA